MNLQTCELCGFQGQAVERQKVRCDIRKFREERFDVWRCSKCGSLHCEEVPDLDRYYEDYPLRRQTEFSFFNNQWFAVLLKRLVQQGLKPTDKILDHGCGSGLLIKYLQKKGYANCSGYDPYVKEYQDTSVLKDQYDWILSMDVIEHVSAPQKQVHEFVKILEPQGHLCVQTPRADGIDLSNPEEHLHELHVPCHLHMYSEGTLIEHGARAGLSVRAIYRRWYVDSWAPFCSRRFIDLFMMAHGNDVDAAFDPPRVSVMLTTPRLWFYALFGYFLPNNKTDTMMVVFGRGTY